MDKILSTHTGSIIRPEKLLDFLATMERGEPGAFLRRVHPTIQWAKLEALAEGARLATKQLSAVRSDA